MNERIHLLRVDGRPIIAQSITVLKNVPGREVVKMRVESKRQTSLVRGCEMAEAKRHTHLFARSLHCKKLHKDVEMS